MGPSVGTSVGPSVGAAVGFVLSNGRKKLVFKSSFFVVSPLNAK